MSWAQIIAAIKMGLVASAESVANIISGVTKVGNADKLDGKDSSEFATVDTLKALGNMGFTNFKVLPDTVDPDNPTTEECCYICRPGGNHMLFGYNKNYQNGYGYQIKLNYVDVESRGRSNTATWSQWTKINDGGNADKLDGFHAVDFLKLTGGTISGNSFAPLQINRSTQSAAQVALAFLLAGTLLASIGAKTDGELYAYDSSSNVKGKILHTGNSVPVVVSTTAPSDTTAVWIIPS